MAGCGVVVDTLWEAGGRLRVGGFVDPSSSFVSFLFILLGDFLFFFSPSLVSSFFHFYFFSFFVRILGALTSSCPQPHISKLIKPLLFN